MRYCHYFLFFCLFAQNSFSKSVTKKQESTTQMLIIGDSITEGYGVSSEKAYPALLEARLNDKLGKKIKLVPSAISGSTTATGPDRFKWITKRPEVFQHLVLFLGGNDILRSIDPQESKKNLRQTLLAMKEYQTKHPKEKVQIYLVEMKIPKNYGSKTALAWEQMYKDLQKEISFHFIPFPLAEIALKKEWNLADGIHPNEKGHNKLADYFLDYFIKQGKL